ncbi:hypothetical protein ACJMK2_041196 [Sinanodonta woodiana]|uniref:Uncharacterized protein n=1 Tax=Sinanodonta woodiana TaxID=1069815 RepID=A0ABD3W3D4_SINWO
MEVKLLAEKEASEKAILSFRTECKELVCTFVHKMKEKSPLAYTLVRSLSCIDPNLICKGQDHSIDKFRRVLDILYSCQRVDINECDQIKEEYKKIVQEVQHLSEFKKFRKTEDRVDELLYNSMTGEEMYSRVWNVVRVLLILSHGQASIERRFSVNKEVSTQNLSENSLIARRVIKDHIKSVGGLKGLVVSKELLQSAQVARQKYHTHLEAQKTEKEREKKCLKRKLMEEEVGTLRKDQNTGVGH